MAKKCLFWPNQTLLPLCVSHYKDFTVGVYQNWLFVYFWDENCFQMVKHFHITQFDWKLSIQVNHKRLTSDFFRIGTFWPFLATFGIENATRWQEIFFWFSVWLKTIDFVSYMSEKFIKTLILIGAKSFETQLLSQMEMQTLMEPTIQTQFSCHFQKHTTPLSDI